MQIKRKRDGQIFEVYGTFGGTYWQAYRQKADVEFLIWERADCGPQNGQFVWHWVDGDQFEPWPEN